LNETGKISPHFLLWGLLSTMLFFSFLVVSLLIPRAGAGLCPVPFSWHKSQTCASAGEEILFGAPSDISEKKIL
jgi:hypothetical protein